MWRWGGGKTDLDVHYSAVPQQKYTVCQGHKCDVILATSKQVGVHYLGEKQKPNIYIHMLEGTVEFEWESPSLNSTCMLRCFPKVKPYINYMGVRKRKHEHNLPEVATPVAKVEVSGL